MDCLGRYRLSNRMAIEEEGILINVDKLKAKLKERYPNHNFDIPPKPDTQCKARTLCTKDRIMYTDVEGNLYCGLRYKETKDDNPYQWEWRTCHALVKAAKQGGEQDEIPF